VTGSYAVLFQPGPDFDCLWVRRGPDLVRVDGPSNYETTGYDPNADLHQLLDSFDPASVAVLMTYTWYNINPSNPRSQPTIDALDHLMRQVPTPPNPLPTHE
jgi:hypothetical protein